MAMQAGIQTVVLVDPDDQSESVIGEFELATDGLLELRSAEGPCEEFLSDVVDSINQKDVLSVKVPGKKKYAVSTRYYSRDGDDFLDGLKTYLNHYYSLELRSSQDLVDHPDEYEGL